MLEAMHASNDRAPFASHFCSTHTWVAGVIVAQEGGPGFSTYTADFDLYQEAFTGGNLGYASAIGVVLLLVIALVTGIAVGLLRWRRRLA